MNQEILEVARAIRPYLPSLVSDKASELDAAIARLLAGVADGEEVADELAQLLAQNTETHTWAAQALGHPQLLPPELHRAHDRGMLPGEAGPIDAVKYCCPKGDYVFYRLGPEESASPCPTHHLVLVPG